MRNGQIHGGDIAGDSQALEKSDAKIKMDSIADDKPGRSVQMAYRINDVPPWYLCILLGFQQFLTMLGATVALPFILAPLMCIGPEDGVVASEILGTLFFVSGIATLIQTTFGTRLPIVQGGTYAFLVAAAAILSLDKWKCPSPGQSAGPQNESANASTSTGIWRDRMLEIQGAIILASIFEIILGVTGVIGVLMRFITPMPIASFISLIGLSLYRAAATHCGGNWWIAFMTMGLVALFSQYLQNKPIPCYGLTNGKCTRQSKFPIFRLFPIIMAVAISWFFCYVLTVTNAIPNDPQHWSYKARTDSGGDAVQQAAWIRFPYPFQWGWPTFSLASVLGMLPAVFCGIVESIGDYYACARISDAPSPPVHVVNRGIFIEGVMCVVSGMFGTGTGTTSYSENIGAIGITKAGSRRIIQTAAIIMIFGGVLGKFGALFIAIPAPVIGAVLMVMFGMIAAVGISNLQFVDLNSTRNLFIFGVSIMLGLSIPDWLSTHPNAIRTGSEIFDHIMLILGNMSMFVGGTVAMILDNTIPGTDEERGLTKLLNQNKAEPEVDDDAVTPAPDTTYDLPFGMATIRNSPWTRFVPICFTFTGFSFLSRSEKETKGEDRQEKIWHRNLSIDEEEEYSGDGGLHTNGLSRSTVI